MITADDLYTLCPQAKPFIVNGILDNQDLLDAYEINTPLRLCHLMAQLAHESAHFQTTREYASGKAYEGRRDLGNTRPGDGPRYRGRGLIQITGRANAREYGDLLGQPFEDRPELMEQFPAALEVSLVYWQNRSINEPADEDNIRRVTKLINGGYNGLEDRERYLERAKGIWGA